MDERGFTRARADGRMVTARADPQDLCDALQATFGEELCERAVRNLADRLPQFSARRRATLSQATFLLGLPPAMLSFFLLAPEGAAWLATSLFALLFLAVAGLRLLAFLPVRAIGPARLPEIADCDLPVYTVLVPLFRETEVVGQLVAALDAIDYPAAKRDIKLVLEASDMETRRHVQDLRLPEGFEVLFVPDQQPRTKPKALNYALAFARGSLVTIYDAEDIPDPGQLRLAARTFAASPPDLACLQAPLTFYNARDGWLTRQMTIEYAVLFDLVLPSLAAFGLPMPLGGTSNHFRIEALRSAGAWDPYNVTEDADLGLRLARLGWRTGVIAAPTREEAPASLGVWLGQRVRWLKGWMQTLLVHSRAPLRLWRELGSLGMIAAATFTLGVVVSALAYPFCLGYVLGSALFGNLLPPDPTVTAAALMGANLVVLVLGYGAALASGLVAVLRRKPALAVGVLTMPFYWLLVSAAGWLALVELIVAPFRWNKTRHGLTRNRETGKGLERAMGIEPTTSSLGSLRSTTELRPRRPEKATGSRVPVKPLAMRGRLPPRPERRPSR